MPIRYTLNSACLSTITNMATTRTFEFTHEKIHFMLLRVFRNLLTGR